MDRYRFSDEERKLLEGLAQPLGIFQFLDKRVVTTVLSMGFCDVFGYRDLAEAYFDMDNNMYKYAHPDDVARIAEAAIRFATEDGTYEVIYRTRTKYSEDYRIIHAIGKHVYTDDGTRLAHVWYTDEGAFSDEDKSHRTELNRAFNSALHEESIVRERNFDYLTGLPSMTYFFDLADEAKRLILEEGETPVMLYMDLNGMKFFNAQNGFSKGDSLLREFARTLKDMFGDRNCCRVGADHFAAYTVESRHEETLRRFLEACADINDGNSLPVRVGIYSNRIGDVPVSTACDRAKFACDSLRKTYESSFGYYDSSLLDEAERRRYILSTLDRAIEEKWIQVYYQPIIRAVNGRVCDEEALSRWFDPKLGPLSPIDFIPVLEDAGKLYKLDLYVLEQVLERMRRQRKAGLSIVPCSINLSRSDFTACDIVEEIRARVDATDIERDKITIEITESTIGDDLELMKTIVKRFQNLGFRIWMDDFGSGYSSIELLQSMEFDLVKFDMSFMRRLDEGEDGKIILTELVRMATALGIETLCEGVETEEQMRFLQEVGCSKLQGYYFCRPIPFEEILARYENGTQIGFENPDESAYFEAIGKVNLYDFAMMSNEDDENLKNYFDVFPMGVMEIDGDAIEYIRTNQTFRDFMKRFFGFNSKGEANDQAAASYAAASSFAKMVQQCCEKEGRAFFDETMPDGTVVHGFARRIGVNPVSGKIAAAIAVLSIAEETEGTTYADVARALASDYYNIYYVDLDSEKFIEYSSQVGGEELAMERHGEKFFESSKHDALTRVYAEDLDRFLANFTKEKIVQELGRQGSFSVTYRLVDSGMPVYANMKVTRLHPEANKIIVGVSIVDSQMKQQELFTRLQQERNVLKSVAALSGNYLSVYNIDPKTGRYIECSATDEYETLGLAKEGEDFFEQSIEDVKNTVDHEDLSKFLERFTKENILREVHDHGAFNMQYRLMINGQSKPVSLRIAQIEENGVEKLVAGVRPWQKRRSDERPSN